MPDDSTVPRPRKRAAGPKPSDPEGKLTTESTGATDTGGTSGNGGGGAAAGAGATATAKTRPRPRGGSLEARLAEFFAGGALIAAAAGDQFSAGVIANAADPLAEAWGNLAKESPAVKRVLESLTASSAWGTAVFTTLGVAIPIMSHHGLWRGPMPFTHFLPDQAAGPSHGASAAGQGGGSSFRWSRGNGGAPERVIIPDPPTPDRDPPAPVYLEGAPPGVVTVAASHANHNGAR